MNRHWGWTLGVGLAALAAGLATFPPSGQAAQKEAAKDKAGPGHAVYTLDRVWTFHLQLSADEFRAMQPKAPPLFPGFGPTPAADSDRNVFGTEFPWVVGDFTADGAAFGPAGFRYKGNSTFMAASRHLKRSVKIELDHYDEDYRFHGLKTLNLNCSILDPTRIREALAYSVFRAAGYPAPRTAFAEVFITVPGKYDRELMGLYTLVEQVDRTFLKDRFKNNKGLVLKPERMRGLDHYGDDWSRYVRNYQPRRDATPEEAKRVIEFVRLVSKGSDEQFAREIGNYLDVDAFLRFLACNAMVSALDTFFALGHNYFLYLNPETNRFVFIPWDLDLALGNFAMMATNDQQCNLSLAHPYPGSSKLTDRLMALPGMEQRFVQVAKDVAEKAFTREKLMDSLERVEKVTAEILAREMKAIQTRKEPPTTSPGGPLFGKPLEIRTFMERRIVSVAAQLTGTSKGVIPGLGFPFGGGRDVIPGQPAPK